MNQDEETDSCHLTESFTALAALAETLSRSKGRKLRHKIRRLNKREGKRERKEEAQKLLSHRRLRHKKPPSSADPAPLLTTTPIPTYKGKKLASVGDGVSVGQGPMGKSLRSTRNFSCGDYITQYEGTLLTREEIKVLPLAERTHIFSRGQGGGIDGLKEVSEYKGGGSFANHSTTPNAVLERTECGVLLKATRDIPDGHFIMISYGKSFLISEIGSCHKMDAEKK